MVKNNHIPYLPDGRPAPFILTGEEAVALLRLEDESGLRTLKYYRDEGLLTGIRLGRRMRYSLDEVCRFVCQKVSDNGGVGLTGQSSYNSKPNNNNNLGVRNSE